MPGNALTHPGRDTLSAFGLGKLPPDEARQIEQHITECEPCCRTLLDLQGDSFVELVQASNRSARSDTETDIQPATPLGGLQERPRGADSVPVELADHRRYRVVELLGRGGMGDVYKAEHRLMNRHVAVKVIKPELLARPLVAERFSREVQAAAQLSHPNIVTAYDAERAGDTHFLVMEYVDGTDLAALVRQRGPLPVDMACDFICQAAAGLQHAHDRGMVHRDIKPHNLMVTSTGCVKILDFGLATLTADAASAASSPTGGDASPCSQFESGEGENRLTGIGCTMGTPDFISPEQAASANSADARSDIYSLGCTLYFLLSGKPPFAEESTTGKLNAHCRRERPRIEAVRGDIPPALADVVSQMMATDPADRFQTAGESAAAVASSLDTQTSPESAESGGRGAWTLSGVRGVLWATAGMVVMICALAAMLAVYAGRTTLRVVVGDPRVAVQFADDTITIDNDGNEIPLEPGAKHTFVVVHRGNPAGKVRGSFRLQRGQQAVLRVSLAEDGSVQTELDGDELALAHAPTPGELDSGHPAAENAPPRPPAAPVRPNVNASSEFPGVYHSPSADATPGVFRSVLQLELVIRRGGRRAQVEYANGTVVTADGLIATVIAEPSTASSETVEIDSVVILTLGGGGSPATLVKYDEKHGLALLRAAELDLPGLPLSREPLVANRRITWHTVYRDGRKTWLYTRPLRIHKPDHAFAQKADICEVIDLGTSALSPERSGSALVSADGTLLALMGRQSHWQIVSNSPTDRMKVAWAVPGHVIASLVEDATAP